MFSAMIPHHVSRSKPPILPQLQASIGEKIVCKSSCVTRVVVRVEDATNHGRIAMAVVMPGHIWLFEFKVVESAPKGWPCSSCWIKAMQTSIVCMGCQFIWLAWSLHGKRVMWWGLRCMESARETGLVARLPSTIQLATFDLFGCRNITNDDTVCNGDRLVTTATRLAGL
jgi:hypothetical protein